MKDGHTFNRLMGALGISGLMAMSTGCHVVMLNADDIIVCQDAETADRRWAQSPFDGARSVQIAATQAQPQGRKGFNHNSRPENKLAVETHGKTELCAYLERRWSVLTVGCLQNVPVDFSRDGEALGTAYTDENGCARILCDAGADTWQFTARAKISTGGFESVGEVFVWAPDRPVIVVDLDETLVQSRYIGMLLWQHDSSPPMSDAREAMRKLARDYGIIYVSARARVLRDMTQRWLRKHDFPPGPVVHAASFASVFDQQGAKHEIVQALILRGVNVVAGIGDKSADEIAFDDAGLFTVVIRPRYSARRAGTVVLDNWKDVTNVVNRHVSADSVTDPATAPNRYDESAD